MATELSKEKIREKQILHKAGVLADFGLQHGKPNTKEQYYEGFKDGARWADENPKEESVNEDLNKEIEIWQDYYAGKNNPIQRELIKQVAYHFAKWQKKQMMKDAIDCRVYPDDCEIWAEKQDLKHFDEGDKIKVIIIKKD